MNLHPGALIDKLTGLLVDATDWFAYGRTETDRVTYRILRGTHERENDVLRDLIAAIARARREIGVACDSCDVEHATPKLRDDLRAALTTARGRGVDVWLLIYNDPPQLFRAFEIDGLLRIGRLATPSGFSFRVIDGLEYRQHEHAAFCQPGPYLDTLPLSPAAS